MRIAKAGVRMLYADASPAGSESSDGDFIVVDTPETVATRALSGALSAALSAKLDRQPPAAAAAAGPGGKEGAADAGAALSAPPPPSGANKTPAAAAGDGGGDAVRDLRRSGGGGSALIIEAEDVDVMVRQQAAIFKHMSGAAERLTSDMKALAARAAMQPATAAPSQQQGRALGFLACCTACNCDTASSSSAEIVAARAVHAPLSGHAGMSPTRASHTRQQQS